MTDALALLGTHLPVAGRLATLPERAAGMGAASVQVFLGNPRGWAMTPGDPGVDAAFRTAAADHGLTVLVHAAYLVNLGSPVPETARRSAAALAYSLRRARDVGACGVVVHTGSCVTAGSRDDALRQVRELLLPLLDELDTARSGPDLLLEPTAGQGQSLCATVDDLEPYLAALDDHPQARVCLDTCHLFAAGHDLATPGGMTAMLDRFADIAGADRLAAVHANDSMDACGSLRDRHQRIGAGQIGAAAFGELLHHKSVAGLPVVLETPGGPPAYAEDLSLLKELQPSSQK